jgi:hypothetical protein
VDLYEEARRYPFRLTTNSAPRWYRELRTAGLSHNAIAWRARKGRLARPHHGIYTSGVDGLLDAVHAALVAAPPLAVVGFHTAASLYGFGVVPTSDVHLAVPAGTPFPQRGGIVAHQVALAIGEPVDVLGVPCVPPARAAVDLARLLPRPDAIAVLDAALYCGACTLDSLLAELARHDHLRGVCRARQVVPLADGRAECRQESQLRLVLHDGGVRGLTPQVSVVDDSGRPRYRIDLADEEHRVGLEYDGVSHLDRPRMRVDRARHNWLSERGWTMRYFTDHDIYRDPDSVVPTALAARAAARRNRRDPHQSI